MIQVSSHLLIAVCTSRAVELEPVTFKMPEWSWSWSQSFYICWSGAGAGVSHFKYTGVELELEPVILKMLRQSWS